MEKEKYELFKTDRVELDVYKRQIYNRDGNRACL